jgi:hypothetical protein
VANANLTASNIFVGLWDAFASVSDNTNLSFAVFDNVRAERVTNPLAQYVVDETPFEFVSAIVTDSGQIKLTLSGPAASQVTIWRSDDLVNWVNVTNIVIGEPPVEFTEDIDFSVPERFYRAERNP